jgi:hypothetical protein
MPEQGISHRAPNCPRLKSGLLQIIRDLKNRFWRMQFRVRFLSGH